MKQFVRTFYILIFFVLFTVAARAQNSGSPVGEWRVYQPNVNARSVAVTLNRVYCATETGFFYYDKEFNNLKVLSKLDGLHDVEISTIKYDSITATLVVAYRNTNIDLIRGDQIINVNDVLRKSIVGEKTIYHIYCKDKVAYLSCSFGLVVLDLVKLEIRDTYFFQNSDGSPRRVYAATALNDQLFIATSGGVMSALNNRTVNLSDQKNWKTSVLPQLTSDNLRTIATFNNTVYAGMNHVDLFKLDGTNWVKTNKVQNVKITQLTPVRKNLLITNQWNFILMDASDNPIYKDDVLLDNPQEVSADRNGIYWVADYTNGLVRFDGVKGQNYIPNGPAFVNSFRLYSDAQSLIVLSGGYRNATQNDSEAGFYEFKNGDWQSYYYQRFKDTLQFPAVRDLTDAVRNPANGKLYISSYGYGVMEWNGVGDFKLHGYYNSPLVSILPSTDKNAPRFVRVSGLTTDDAGNIWVANPSGVSGAAGLHVLRPNNTWESFPMQLSSEGMRFAYPHTIERIVIDDNGYKWCGLKGAPGLLVFDDIKNRFRYLTNSPTTGNLPGAQVTALAKDQKGEIWVGTSNGIGVYFNPEQVFSGNNTISANIPHVNRRPLLDGQIVKCIAVDGANRKWVGTETGLWLFNADGEEAILNFTTKNSPLPSDRINDININHSSGDVFIATEAGLVSYRAGATITTEKPECANVFPNPVRPGFTGQIAISGIANNAIVKITDITGTLVYETKALGGTAIWNGADYNGERVKPGVYLVLSSNTEGGDTCISKVAVIK